MSSRVLVSIAILLLGSCSDDNNDSKSVTPTEDAGDVAVDTSGGSTGSALDAGDDVDVTVDTDASTGPYYIAGDVGSGNSCDVVCIMEGYVCEEGPWFWDNAGTKAEYSHGGGLFADCATAPPLTDVGIAGIVEDLVAYTCRCVDP